ncbi:MAG: hypothetical protein FVQ79_14025, partial [Planctomycetes bacterium]|nr:hypothetical protein [Planctomycetota bacterium]
MNKCYLTSVFVLSLLCVFAGLSYGCPNAPPTAIATCGFTVPTSAEAVTVKVGETVYFDGSTSTDTSQGGSVVAYRWIFPPEAYAISGENTANAKCKFYPAGNCDVYLMVQDNEGAWSDSPGDDCAITVTAASSTDWY